MKAILICPTDRPAVEPLRAIAPLAAIPLLGESLVEYWLSHAALTGATDIRILCNDRPEYISAMVGDGARWGVKAEVICEPREFTAAQAEIKYAKDLADESHEVAVLDHFPGSQRPLFASYESLFAGIFEWLPHARMPDRVGCREIRPGVWIGSQSRVSEEAQVHAPCWIGQHVFVSPKSVVGPMAVIEDRSFLETDAEVVNSVVGRDTFVGYGASIRNAFAWGGALVNWKSGLFAAVRDESLLCALRRPMVSVHQENLLSRLSDLYAKNKDDLQMFWKNLVTDRE